MTVNELRIGNYVLSNGAICSVYGIASPQPMLDERFSDKYVIDVYVSGILSLPMDDINPIPLTEEWLLKFGFEKVSDNWMVLEFYHYENKNCWIYLIENGFELELITLSERVNLCRTYKYVHQLQNLFYAITGEELTIKSENN